MSRKRFYYCQSSIEGGSECKKQCAHCKEYYAPLEVLRSRVPRKLKKKKKKLYKKLEGWGYRIVSITKTSPGAHTIKLEKR